MDRTERANSYSSNTIYKKKLEGSAITCDTDSDYDEKECELELEPCNNFGFKIEPKQEIIYSNIETAQRAKSLTFTLVASDVDQGFIADFAQSSRSNYFTVAWNKFIAKIINLAIKIKNAIDYFGHRVNFILSSRPKKKLQDLVRESEQLKEEAELYKEISSIHAQLYLKEINTMVVPYELYLNDPSAQQEQEQHDAEAYQHIEIASYCKTQSKALNNKIAVIEKQIIVFEKEINKDE